MRKLKKILIPLLMIVIGTSSMMLVGGCASKAPFVMHDGVDRQWVDKGQELIAPVNGVYLSDRAFKHYSKGCK